jgi:hypothetical protein
MSSTERPIDCEQARRDPGAVFPSPEALRDHPQPTLGRKIEQPVSAVGRSASIPGSIRCSWPSRPAP